MNALTMRDFNVVAPVAEWLVLRCSPGRTMALAAALADRGAWTPTWKRRRRMPRSSTFRPITEACIPTFVFIPARQANDLPEVPRIPFSLMRIEGALIRIRDRELEHLRKIADKPLLPARALPKPGRTYQITGLGFDGLTGKVIRCDQRKCFVEVAGFAHPLQVPPTLLTDATL